MIIPVPANPARNNPGAGWSSPVARQAHNLKVTGSNPVPATSRDNKAARPIYKLSTGELALPGFCGERLAHVAGLSLEGDGALEAER
jgi:hypothetical protein